jgi:hypothetical protein
MPHVKRKRVQTQDSCQAESRRLEVLSSLANDEGNHVHFLAQKGNPKSQARSRNGMTLLQALGLEKTQAEKFIDAKREDVTFDIQVNPSDYDNGSKHDPLNSPLALAVKRSLQGSQFVLDRAGFKVIIISRGIYEYGFFMPRRVWRKVNCQEFVDDKRPSSPIRFKATFSMLF